MKYWIRINQIAAKQRDKHIQSAKCWVEASLTLHRQNNQWALQARYKVVPRIVCIHVLGIKTLESWSAYDVLELIHSKDIPAKNKDLWPKQWSLTEENIIMEWRKDLWLKQNLALSKRFINTKDSEGKQAFAKFAISLV